MTPSRPPEILIPTSLGELIDKITILEIKTEHLSGPQRENVSRELELLRGVLLRLGLAISPELSHALKEVNQALWVIEDSIRALERRQDSGEDFIELARSRYLTNDKRAALKRRINEEYGSGIIEEKSYEPYSRSGGTNSSVQ
jgi:hypothetical protein